MNRGIDYRTDFYSLGVTLFELLTGRLPFANKEPMDLVHCHLAKLPVPPHEMSSLGSNIPKIISEIILKLMAKNAEDRYQSALGLKYDLEQCLQQWLKKGTIDNFELGQRDVSDRFIIPEKLYGRETEVQALLDAFERVAKGKTEMILVAGFSGIGKTAVVNEVHKPITRQQGYFIKGKFDQFNRNIPFSAFVQAFRSLMGQLLSESEAKLREWRANILAAVGESGQVIIDVIPELESIIGQQPPVAELSGTAAQNRFNLLFGKFVQVFTAKEHPLVIFLDDLQWVDSASLNLLELLMNKSEVGYLLVLGAYRDNEVYPAHPLMLTLAELAKNQADMTTITLKPLAVAHINQLVAETLNCSLEIAQPLTELVYQKTQGNPFFTTQFLQGLHEEQLIRFNYNLGYWECDLVSVIEAALTNDVVEFMARRLQKLPEATQGVLKLAACIGNKFDLETLTVACEDSQEEVATNLWPVLQEGFVIPESRNYKFFQGEEQKEQTIKAVVIGYRFLHDRVQQAAYFLIPPDQREWTHFRIGKQLQNHYVDNLEDELFEVISHLNFGSCFIETDSEREELASLNCLAMRKALASTAYQAALEYFQKGISLLKNNCWETQYSLALELYQLASQVYYLCNEYQQMESLIQIVLDNASSLLDKLPVYEVQIQAYISQNNQQLALQLGLEILELLQVDLIQKIPEHPDSIEALIDYPVLQNPKLIAALKILTNIITPAWTLDPKYFKETILTMVSLSLECGMYSDSAFGFAWYATWLCESQGDINAGYSFGKLAMQLVDRFDAKSLRSSVFVLFATHVGHWKEHILQCLPIHIQGLQSGLETGNLEYACYGAAEYSQYLFLTGKPLDEIEPDCQQKLQIIRGLKQDFHVQYLAPWHQGILNLQSNQLEEIERLVGDSYDETNLIEKVVKDNQLTLGFSIFFVKMFLAYLFGKFTKAIDFGDHACRYTAGVFGTYFVPTTIFYYSLSLLAYYRDCDASMSQQHLALIEQNLDKFRSWSDFAPMNYQHKYYLLAAENYQNHGSKLEAMKLYDRAIAGAKANGYIQEEALACELAAKFYLDWDKEKIARVYLSDAYSAYSYWGAKAKIQQLEEQYPHLLLQKITALTSTSITQSTTLTTSVSSSGDILDLETLLKASQAISGEIVLSNLLTTFVAILLANTGAQSVFLILEERGEFLIEAAGSVEGEVQVLQSMPIEYVDADGEMPLLSSAIINYVYRTQESLVLADATQTGNFTQERYIQAYQVKSVLCVPLLNQTQLSGIVYLENNLTTDAFTPERVNLLQMLSGQAAIAIDHARLYESLEQKVRERTQALQDTNQERQRHRLRQIRVWSPNSL